MGGGEGNGGKKGKGFQETWIRDPWTKPKGVRIEGGGGDGWGEGKLWEENGGNYTWKQLQKKRKINEVGRKKSVWI